MLTTFQFIANGENTDLGPPVLRIVVAEIKRAQEKLQCRQKTEVLNVLGHRQK